MEFSIPPVKVIKQGGHEAKVALKPWQSVPTNQHLSQNQCTQIQEKKIKTNQPQAANQPSPKQATA